jgi:hypothetical protein
MCCPSVEPRLGSLFDFPSQNCQHRRTAFLRMESNSGAAERKIAPAGGPIASSSAEKGRQVQRTRCFAKSSVGIVSGTGDDQCSVDPSGPCSRGTSLLRTTNSLRPASAACQLSSSSPAAAWPIAASSASLVI